MTAITLPGFTRSATSGGLPLAQAFAAGAGVRLTGSTSGTVDLFPPATVTTPYTLTLPAALGASDKIIQVSSTGVLSLADPVSPAGTGTEIQYRNGSAFGAVAGSSWDGTTLAVPKCSIVADNSSGYLFSTGVGVVGLTSGALLVGGWKFDSSTLSKDSAVLTLQTSAGAIVSSIAMYGTSSGYVTVTTNSVLRMSVLGDGAIVVGNGGTNAAPNSGLLRGTGGSGTNVVGGTLYIAPGPSTGNATPSSVIIQSTVAGTSGSTAQTLADTLTVTNGNVLIGDSATSILSDRSLNIIATNAVAKIRRHSDSGAPAVELIAMRTGGLVESGYWDFYVGPNDFLPGSFVIRDRAAGRTGETNRIVINTLGKMGICCTLPDRQLEINATDGNCLRLTHNDSNGSAANYADFAVTSAGNLTITPSGSYLALADAKDFAVGTTTGTKIGTATTQKLGLWNATPIVQPTTGYSEATFVQNSGDAINDNSTFDGYTLRQVVAALRGMGALA